MKLIPIPQESLYDFLIENIKDAGSIKIAVAFIQISGANFLRKEAKGKNVRVIYGKNLFITDPRAIRILYDAGFQVKYFDTLGGHVFHPKLYIIEKDDETLIIIGSSNMSVHAFKQNVELNICFSSNSNPEEDNIVRTALNYFDNLWNSSNCKMTNKEEISSYEEKFNRVNLDKQNLKQTMINEYGEESAAILTGFLDDSESYLDNTEKPYMIGTRTFTISEAHFHEKLENLILHKEIPKIKNLYVVHRGKALPLKWVISEIFGIFVGNYHTYEVLKIFKENNYQVYAKKPYSSHKKESILHRPIR